MALLSSSPMISSTYLAVEQPSSTGLSITYRIEVPDSLTTTMLAVSLVVVIVVGVVIRATDN